MVSTAGSSWDGISLRIPKSAAASTFKGTRIMVWIVLEQLDEGLTWDEIVREWRGKASKDAIAETIAIAPLVVKHEPFSGFHPGADSLPQRGRGPGCARSQRWR